MELFINMPLIDRHGINILIYVMNGFRECMNGLDSDRAMKVMLDAISEMGPYIHMDFIRIDLHIDGSCDISLRTVFSRPAFAMVEVINMAERKIKNHPVFNSPIDVSSSLLYKNARQREAVLNIMAYAVVLSIDELFGVNRCPFVAI